MVNSKEILEATGLSGKTLTRWAKAGLIPEPLIRTHPSGRGKLGYWPDWVLTKCIDLVALRAEGHSLQSAAMELSLRDIGRTVTKVLARKSIQEVLSEKKLNLKDGRQVSGLHLALASLRLQLEACGLTREKQMAILAAFQGDGGFDVAFVTLENGYNPVLVVDGMTVSVVPDFLVSHHLSETAETAQPQLVIKLLPLLRKVYSLTSRPAPTPTVRPATAVDIHRDGVVVRTQVLPLGLSSFELIHENSQTIAMSEVKDDKE